MGPSRASNNSMYHVSLIFIDAKTMKARYLERNEITSLEHILGIFCDRGCSEHALLSVNRSLEFIFRGYTHLNL